VLTAVFALVAVIALPGSLSASGEQVPASAQGGPVTPEVPDSSPVPEAEPPATAEGGAGVEPPADTDPPAGEEPTPAPPEAQPAAAAPAPATETAPALAEEPATAPVPAERRAHRDQADRPERLHVVARAAASQSVTIRNYAFSPRTVTVQAGDTVIWTNEDDVQHSATSDDGTFDTGLIGEGQSGSHTFSEAGRYQYICTPHPNMHGTVVVEAASTGGDADSGADPGAAGDSSSGSDSSSTSGSSSGASGTSSGSSSTLPDTGADVPTLTIMGLLFLALGAAVQSRARRERSDGRSG
jgi:LPXTG-motif cell wall-anchored protein